jgi:transcriptional regulator with XRE-family HTH domain
VAAQRHPYFGERAFDWRETVRSWRVRQALTQAQVAERSGLALASVRAYEYGKRHPSQTALLSLVSALGIPREEANNVLMGAGYAVDWQGMLRQNFLPLRVEELEAEAAALPWPAFVTNQSFDVLYANRPTQLLLDVDLDREFTGFGERNMSLIAVDDEGLPSPGGASFEPGAGHAIHNLGAPFPGKLLIDGFVTASPDDAPVGLSIGNDVTINNLTSNNSGDDGLRIRGNGDNAITVMNSTFNNNTGDGFNPFDSTAPLIVSNVTANGNGEDGMELNVSGDITISGATTNGNLGVSFGGDGIATATTGSVTISDVTANGNAVDGVSTDTATSTTGIAGLGGAASVTLEDSVAADNGDDGFEFKATGAVTIDRASATFNPDDGFDIQANHIAIADSIAGDNDDDGFELDSPGDISVTRSTASHNGDDGFELTAEGDLALDQVTSAGNSDDGIDFNPFQTIGSVEVFDSLITDNSAQGVDYDEPPLGFPAPDVQSTSGNIICGNGEAGMDVDWDADIGAEGNWWGAPSGPTHASNPGGSGDAVLDTQNGGGGSVDFDPWIDTIAGANIGTPRVGLEHVVTFSFTGNGGSVSFQNGPGDPNGPPTFTAASDNGTATADFMEDGELQVRLVAEAEGTATVSVTGPCGLGTTTNGSNSVTVDVEPSGDDVVWGDNNCSSAADPIDSLLTLRFDAGLPTDTGACPDMGQVVEVAEASPHPWGDIDCDGTAGPVDSLKLLRYDGGMSVTQNPDCPEVGSVVLVSE